MTGVLRTLAAAIVAVALSGGGAVATASAEPLAAAEYAARLGQGLAAVQARMAPAAARSAGPLEVGVNLVFAHEAWIQGTPEDVLLRAVDAIADAGADRIDLNMGPFPWLDGDAPAIAKYDAVVDRVRARGLRLHINPQYSPVAHRFGSLTAWEGAAAHFYPVIAARYRPDTFVVVHEPTTLAARMGFEATPAAWAGVADRLARTVRAASPGTRLGAGVLHTETAYLDAFARLDSLDVLGLDIYSLRGLRAFNAMIETARAAGKPVFVEETGRPPFIGTGPAPASLDRAAMRHVGHAAFADLDVAWLETVATYARVHRLEGVTLFWTHTLFHYADKGGHADDPGYTRAVYAAVRAGERTPLYHAVGRLAGGSIR